MGKMLTGEKLEKRANQLGVSLNNLYSSNGLADEPELQRRVIEAERHRRDGCLWLIALISALASAASAVAAWVAVARHP